MFTIQPKQKDLFDSHSIAYLSAISLHNQLDGITYASETSHSFIGLIRRASDAGTGKMTLLTKSLNVVWYVAPPFAARLFKIFRKLTHLPVGRLIAQTLDTLSILQKPKFRRKKQHAIPSEQDGELEGVAAQPAKTRMSTLKRDQWKRILKGWVIWVSIDFGEGESQC